MSHLPVETRQFCSYDETLLTYYVAGDTSRPTLVLCNGLGGSSVVWGPVVRHFAARYRILSWDYRGLFESQPAADKKAYSITHHVLDLLALLEHEKVDSPIIVGWSMGVQVALELHRTHPDVARAMVAIFGTSGRPLDTAFDSPMAAPPMRVAFALMRILKRRLGGVGSRLAASPGVAERFVRLWKRLGWLAPSLDMHTFRAIVEDWVRLDMGVYAEVFDQLSRHDASDLLAGVKTPVLIIAGGSDRFTPAHLSETMAERLQDAELRIVPGATHFGLLEYPEVINEAIDEFLTKRCESAEPGRAAGP